MENQKQKKELVATQNLNELRNELSKYGYETTFDDIILLFQESIKRKRRKGENLSPEKMEEVITHFWTEWENSGSPMGYDVAKQIKDEETEKMVDVIEFGDREGITLKTHLSWFFLLCSLYEEYRWSRKRADEPKA